MLAESPGAASRGWIGVVAMAIAFALACGTTLAFFNHNEQMYVAAGWLAAEGKSLYRDFSYVQMPLLPLVYGLLFRLADGAHALLIAKLASLAATALAAGALYRIARRQFGRGMESGLLVALFLLAPAIVLPAAEVSNYAWPMALSLWALALLDGLSADGGATRPALRAAGAGLLLALATSVKLTYLALIPPVGAALVWHALARRQHEHRADELHDAWRNAPDAAFAARLIGGFALGTALGLAPVWFYLLRDPQAFAFNNFLYHALNAQWRGTSGYDGPMSLGARLAFGRDLMLQAPNLGVVVAAAGCLLLRAGLSARLTASAATLAAPTAGNAAFAISPARPRSALARALVLALPAAFLAAVAPTPAFPQYYAVPMSLGFVVLAIALARQTAPTRRWLLAALIALTLGAGAVDVARAGLNLLRPSHWSWVQWRNLGQRLGAAVTAAGGDRHGRLATLAPIAAIAAGMPTYPELATGAFAYRIGDLLDAPARAHFVVTSPATIAALLDAAPPAAILVGFEGELDQPLIDYATARGYREIAGDWTDSRPDGKSADPPRGRLFVRSAQ